MLLAAIKTVFRTTIIIYYYYYTQLACKRQRQSTKQFYYNTLSCPLIIITTTTRIEYYINTDIPHVPKPRFEVVLILVFRLYTSRPLPLK